MSDRPAGLKFDRNCPWVYKFEPRDSVSITEYDQSCSTRGRNKSYREEVWERVAEHRVVPILGLFSLGVLLP